MTQRQNNYEIQAQQAKKLFLTYDQQEIIERCRLCFDETYFYFRFLGSDYRLCRNTGDMERKTAQICHRQMGKHCDPKPCRPPGIAGRGRRLAGCII